MNEKILDSLCEELAVTRPVPQDRWQHNVDSVMLVCTEELRARRRVPQDLQDLQDRLTRLEQRATKEREELLKLRRWQRGFAKKLKRVAKRMKQLAEDPTLESEEDGE